MSESTKLHNIRRVCVFCGSNGGNDPAFRQAADEMGGEIVRRGWELVYGGGSVGLMGVVADGVLAGGGEVIGVIPEMLATKELLHTGVTRMHIAPTMHARKALMEQSADAFVALPGGYGTFEELLEIITWAQLGMHAKPIGLLNVCGFYDGLTGFFDHAIAAGFIKARHRSLIVTAATPRELLDQLVTHEMPQVKKWIRPDEG
ncbi:MAG TPA: TIGR00730 family Rossman fold protein [Planctomycetaceae bacterium]